MLPLIRRYAPPSPDRGKASTVAIKFPAAPKGSPLGERTLSVKAYGFASSPEGGAFRHLPVSRAKSPPFGGGGFAKQRRRGFRPLASGRTLPRSAALSQKAALHLPLAFTPPPRENGIAERPQALRYSEIINILSAIYAQSATTTTAASGGNREELLGQRPARRECRPRHEADAGCRNPIAEAISNRSTPGGVHHKIRAFGNAILRKIALFQRHPPGGKIRVACALPRL